MKSNECNSFNLHEFNHTSNQIKEKDCKLYKLEITSMETFCKNPITGFLKMEGYVDLWVDANVALCSTPVIRPGINSESSYFFPKNVLSDVYAHDLMISEH